MNEDSPKLLTELVKEWVTMDNEISQYQKKNTSVEWREKRIG